LKSFEGWGLDVGKWRLGVGCWELDVGEKFLL